MTQRTVAAPSASEHGSKKPDFPIVGIGASAGGLESLEQLFAHLPARPQMAFVVVQHLSPDFRSMMSELLSRHSEIPMQVAEDGMEVEPDNAYLLPPKKEITIHGGRLRLVDKDPSHALTLPIDLFFSSLAKDAGPRAVAIVLSGSGSDGSRGVREIKRAGGRVLAESAESAKFDGMPLSALATGLVEYSAAPQNLAHYLLSGEPKELENAESEHELDESPTDAVLRLLRGQFGLDFSLYKKGTVSRRILRRASLRDKDDLDAYVEQLRRDPEELGALYRDLLIGVTRFFRDPEAFDVIERRVIPEIIEQVPESEEIRVWVAGCATGEEAYSLAILLFEQLLERDRPVNFKILATDVHRSSLEHAGAGLYSDEQLEHVGPKRRERFFSRRSQAYQVSQDLRQHIVFAPHDVTQDAPFTNVHLITCRNLLIYLEPDAQRTVLSLFHFGLASFGHLFLGSSETTGAFAHEFDPVDEHWKIYKKRRDVRLIDPLRLPVARKMKGTSNRPAAPSRIPSTTGPQLLSIYDRLLDEYMPPAFLVDDERTLVDSFGGAERYLKVGRRRPSTNILELLEGDLHTVVAGALQRVFGTENAVRYTGVPVPGENGTERISIAAKSFASPRAGGRHVLITLENGAETPPRPDVIEAELSDLAGTEASQEHMRTLEAELAYTRETLQAAVEEQQTSNEELQATNEELVASNEELQSTNEELHSVNEELYTVNGEYQKKILELREVNNDMQHLLEGADNGTLFLDARLRIRKFTPRVAGVFHIRTGDVGRSIRDFTHDLKRPTLLEDIERALTEGGALEDEVRDHHGTTYFLRILPYRPAPDSADEEDEATGSLPTMNEPAQGVMLSLTDISALDHARARVEQLSAIVESPLTTLSSERISAES